MKLSNNKDFAPVFEPTKEGEDCWRKIIKIDKIIKSKAQEVDKDKICDSTAKPKQVEKKSKSTTKDKKEDPASKNMREYAKNTAT